MTAPTSIAPLHALRAAVRGDVAGPDDQGYALALPWNRAVGVRPRAVVAASGPDDVAAAIRVAGEHGLRVVPQRTGHGAVAVGDDVLLVHTGRLDEVAIDPDARLARVGAGATWQQVLDAAAPHGLTAIAGSAPHVGVAGYLTGGGIGPLVRSHGLSSDHVRSMTVATGDGELRRAAADEHPDLLWGLRGGKAALGVVVELELELHPIAVLHGGALFFAGEDAAAVLHAWRAWAAGLPDHATTSVALLQLPAIPGVPEPLAGRPTVAVRFASTADDETCAALVAPIRAAAPVLLDALGPLPSAALGAIHADPVEPMPVHDGGALLTGLPEAAVDALLTHAGPGSGSPQTIVELRQLGGALVDGPDCAFDHRVAPFALLRAGIAAPPLGGEVRRHGAALEQALAPWIGPGLPPNFAAGDDPDRATRCWTPATRRRLHELAARYDPAGTLAAGATGR